MDDGGELHEYLLSMTEPLTYNIGYNIKKNLLDTSTWRTRDPMIPASTSIFLSGMENKTVSPRGSVEDTIYNATVDDVKRKLHDLYNDATQEKTFLDLLDKKLKDNMKETMSDKLHVYKKASSVISQAQKTDTPQQLVDKIDVVEDKGEGFIPHTTHHVHTPHSVLMKPRNIGTVYYDEARFIREGAPGYNVHKPFTFPATGSWT